MGRAIDYDRIASEYARNRRVHPEVLRSLIETSQVSSDSHVLEVGCGTGNYVVALESLVRCGCWGIDPSEQMLARASERSEAIHFHPGRAESLEFPAATFDLLFSVDVIHHVADRSAHFREAQRVLRPGGRVCTVTDSEWIIRHRQPLAAYFPQTVEVDLARYPRVEELAAIMAWAGFGEISERMVEFPYQLVDSQAYRDKAFSALHLISPQAFQAGLARLEEDLRHGPIACLSRYLLLWGTRKVPTLEGQF